MRDEIKKTLWTTTNKLRANREAAEHKHLVLRLIFINCISGTFAARRVALLPRRIFGQTRIADSSD